MVKVSIIYIQFFLRSRYEFNSGCHDHVDNWSLRRKVIFAVTQVNPITNMPNKKRLNNLDLHKRIHIHWRRKKTTLRRILIDTHVLIGRLLWIQFDFKIKWRFKVKQYYSNFKPQWKWALRALLQLFNFFLSCAQWSNGQLMLMLPPLFSANQQFRFFNRSLVHDHRSVHVFRPLCVYLHLGIVFECNQLMRYCWYL